MTPKAKAQELVVKYLAIQFGDFPTTDAKKCALIAVDEILTRMIGSRAYSFNEKLFWSEVKSELQSL